MKYKACDLMSSEIFGVVEVVCITTNGFVKKNGECVMGRGIALAAIRKIPKLPIILGKKLIQQGNHVFHLGQYQNTHIYSFPVKPDYIIFNGHNVVKHMAHRFNIGDKAPGWAAKADISLIKQSFQQMKSIADGSDLKEIYMPIPGCGAGELQWQQDVKSTADEIIGIDNRFTICSFNNSDFTK